MVHRVVKKIKVAQHFLSITTMVLRMCSYSAVKVKRWCCYQAMWWNTAVHSWISYLINRLDQGYFLN